MRSACYAGLPVTAMAGGVLVDAVSSDSAVRRVLERNPIHICTSGNTTVAFSMIVEGLTRPNLIEEVQRTYARMLPDGRQPEFVVVQISSDAYHYSTPHGEHSEIREVSRLQVTPDSIRCVYHIAGRRFFGPFESVIQVDVRQTETDATGYEVNVYAHPDVAAARCVARHLPFIESYFQCKTREIVGLVAGIVKATVMATATHVAEPSLAANGNGGA